MADKSGEVEVRDFAMILMDLPSAHLDASVQFRSVLDAVRDTKKAGAITITINVAPGKLDPNTLEFSPDVKVKIPKHALRGGVFYPDENGNPTKDDPSQLWRGEDIRSAPTFVDNTDAKEAPTV